MGRFYHRFLKAKELVDWKIYQKKKHNLKFRETIIRLIYYFLYVFYFMYFRECVCV